MNTFQLNLFTDEPEPLLFTKKRILQAKPRFLKHCTTKQASILLDTSISTLCRYRQIGQSYKKNGYAAKAIDRNLWEVIL